MKRKYRNGNMQGCDPSPLSYGNTEIGIRKPYPTENKNGNKKYNNQNNKSMAQSYLSLWYHLVWSTKHREPLIKKEWKWDLYARIREFCKTKEYHLDFINGTDDHIHLLISPKPTFALSDIVRDIKRDSYYWIKEQELSTQHFTWQDGYGAFTVSNSMINQVRNYIKTQEQHHQKQTFEAEMDYFKTMVVS